MDIDPTDIGKRTTTPKGVTPSIVAFAKQITGEASPRLEWINVEPLKGAPFGECHNVVNRHVAKNGGAVQNGWIVWEWPSVFMEAEFHAVWVNPAGQFVDLSPKNHGEKRILFIVDPVRTYKGIRVVNRRMALSDSQDVNDMLALLRALDQVRNGMMSMDAYLRVCVAKSGALINLLRDNGG